MQDPLVTITKNNNSISAVTITNGGGGYDDYVESTIPHFVANDPIKMKKDNAEMLARQIEQIPPDFVANAFRAAKEKAIYPTKDKKVKVLCKNKYGATEGIVFAIFNAAEGRGARIGVRFSDVMIPGTNKRTGRSMMVYKDHQWFGVNDLEVIDPGQYINVNEVVANLVSNWANATNTISTMEAKP